MDIEARPSAQQILVSEWSRIEPTSRPIQLTPANPNHKYKYTVENCLPSFLHHTKSRTSCSSNPTLWSQMIRAPYPTTQAYAVMIHQQYCKQLSGGDKAARTHSSTTATELDNSAIANGTAVQEDLHSLGECSTMSLKGHYSAQQKRPLVSKINACGRKIADAMKSVKTQRSHKDNSSSRVNSGQVQ